MAADFDSVATGSADPGTSITPFDLTLVASSNMAVAVGIFMNGSDVTGLSVTVGGVTCNLVSGTDSGASNRRSLIYGAALGSATGAQSVVITWTNSGTIFAAAVGLKDADQTTIFQNGTFARGSDDTPTVAITSATDNLTLAGAVDSFGQAFTGNTQTQRWNGSSSGGNILSRGTTAAGAASNTHSFTLAGANDWSVSGVDVIAASGGGPAPTVTWVGYIG